MKYRVVILTGVTGLVACGGGSRSQAPAPSAAPASVERAPAPNAVPAMSPVDTRPSAANTTARTPLYQRLGGQPALTAVVDAFVGRLAADDRINAFFRGVDIPNLKRLLVEQLCSASGGPCRYSGRTMPAAHQGMNLTDAHFDALVEDLVATLNQFNVPAAEQGELLAVLGPMRRDIVGK